MAWSSWQHVERLVLGSKPGRDHHILKEAVPPPLDAGMQRAVGIPKGTIRHYRRRVRAASCLHVREYATHYEVHWDRHDPRIRPLRHWWADIRGGRLTLPATVAVTVAFVVLAL